MMIIGDYGSGKVPHLSAAQSGRKPERQPQKAETPSPDAATRSRKKGHPKMLHNSESLRASVAKLVDPGEIESTSDGQLRERRVEEARRNKEAGAYDQQDVISSIVDRLLDQWNI